MFYGGMTYDMEMKQNFFEAIGAANIERIHSQMLGWLFSSDVLDPSQKSNLLASLRGLNKEYSKFSCYTEYQNIDILIRADDDLFVIENKIKISQHDNQLERYKKIIDGEEDPIFRGVEKVYYIYLTLVPEDIVGEDWINKTYEDLLLGISKFDQPSNADQYIFNEYVESVQRLVEIFEAFNAEHRKFANVFQEGSLKKHEKLSKIESYDNEDQRYIALNQLETIFQKHFLNRVAKEMNVYVNPSITESHGVANMQFDIKKNLQFGGKKYNIGIQFQGETVKINFAPPVEEYLKSSAGDLPKDVIGAFQEAASEHGMRFNKPKEKGYISISKKQKDETWQNDFKTVVNIYKKKFDECKLIIEGMHLPIEVKNKIW